MTVPSEPASGASDLVVYGDDLEIARWQQDLAAHGLTAIAGGPLSEGAGASIPGARWALVSARELRQLVQRAASGSAQHANGSAPFSTHAEFRNTAAAILASAQPPNDHIAFACVHLVFEGEAQAASAEVEAELVRRVRICIRQRDTAAHSAPAEAPSCLTRLASEDFCLLLTGMERPHLAFKIAERLREKLSEPIVTSAGSVQATVTIGLAMHPEDARDVDTLIEHARTAQRTAVNHQATGPYFFEQGMNAAVGKRVALEAALRQALQRRELSVAYQPKVRIATGEIVGAEALMRWNNPDFGAVSPAQFIPIAEETGLIMALGQFVLEEACRQNAAFRKQGLPPIRMAVNLSTLQLHETGLFESLTRALAEAGLPPDGLELELTESVLLQNVEASLDTMKRLKALGIHLSIDDFGTGYSSLAYLKRFPIDALKIDQAFIRDLTVNPDDAAITTSIILMGKSLKLNVIAEGVETRSQLGLLHVLECDEAQGYLFGRPMPAAAFAELLAKGIEKSLRPSAQ